MPFTALCCRRKEPALRRKLTADKFKNGLHDSWRDLLAGECRGTVESRSLFSSPAAAPLSLCARTGIYEHSMPAIFLHLA